MESLSFRLPDEVIERLNQLADATGRTKTYLVTQAIYRYLDECEDLILAETRWRGIHEGRSKTVPLEEISDQYSLKE